MHLRHLSQQTPAAPAASLSSILSSRTTNLNHTAEYTICTGCRVHSTVSSCTDGSPPSPPPSSSSAGLMYATPLRHIVREDNIGTASSKVSRDAVQFPPPITALSTTTVYRPLRPDLGERYTLTPGNVKFPQSVRYAINISGLRTGEKPLFFEDGSR